MSDVIINPYRMKGDPEIEGQCLFYVNPGEPTFIAHEAGIQKAKRHYLFNGNLYELSGGKKKSYWFGPAMGAPMAVMTMEKLIALGAHSIIVYGWCGAISKKLRTGDILLPTWGHSEEGTSCHYPINAKNAYSCERLRAKVADYLFSLEYTMQQGPIWTTDAPYRETHEKVSTYSQQGILAVDMEFSALATLAIYRQVKLSAVLIVSDELYHSKWRPGFHQKEFKKKNKRLFRDLAHFLTINNQT